MISKKLLGNKAEKSAERYLKERGLKTITRNYNCRYGEIDLIMQDKDTLVFVEVRMRSNSNFGGALASIDYKKQQRLLLTAQTYLQQHQHKSFANQRFDVVGITGKENKTEQTIEWIQNAIEAN